MNAVGAVGRAGGDLVEENDIFAVLGHAHGGVGQARQSGCEARQLMIMGGEQGAGAVDLMQMLKRRPGDGQAIIGGGAAADLIQNDK